MKLKDKATGQIIELKTPICFMAGRYSFEFTSIKELNDKWEDVNDER